MRWWRTLSLFLVVVTGLALTGCGTSQPTPGSTSGSSSDGAFPVTINTKFGNVTIPKRPKRVVALGWGDAETALALGVQPVGAADWLQVGGNGVPPWLPADKTYTTPPVMVGTMNVDMEQIAALQPDLILDTRGSGEQSRHDLETRLGVPVVGIPQGADSYTTTWDQQLDMVGKALGKTAEAAQLKQRVEDRFKQAVAAHPEFAGKTVAVGAKMANAYGAYVNGDQRVAFLNKLGFTNAPAIQQQAGQNFFINVSPERMDLFNADLTMMFPIGVNAEAIKKDPLYQSVPSVQAGRSVVLNKDVSQAFSAGTAYGMLHAIDVVVPQISHALGK